MPDEQFRVSSVVLASPNAVYSAWLDERKHSAFTGGRATVEPWVGGRHTAWDGYIEGMVVELDTGRRIAMTWRTVDFPEDAPMSRVEVDLESVPGGTKISIAHFDIPEGQEEQYKRGWRTNYLDPMKKFFSKPGAMRSAIKAASKARRLPIPGVNSAPPGSVRPPEGPRIKTQQKTAKSAAKHAAAKRAGVGKSSAATQTGKQTAKKSAKSAAKKTAKNKPLKRTAKKPAKKVTKRTEKKAAPKRAAKKKTAKKKPKR